jgi:hypothetical protein
MLRSLTLWLAPVALTLVGFGVSSTPAFAQTTYSFSANYDLVNGGSPLTPDFEYSEIYVSGQSTDAPFGLTELTGLTYLQDFGDGTFVANTDPSVFGFPNLPVGSFVFESSSGDRLFGSETASGTVDLQTFAVENRGTITLTGGEGRFEGATGTLSFFEQGTRGVPYIGTLAVNGSFQVAASQTVPEPKTDTTLIGIGAIAAGLLFGRRSRSLAEKDKASSQFSPLAKV